MRRVLRTRDGQQPEDPAPGDSTQADLEALSDEDRLIVEQALPHTMTSVARLEAVIDAVRYCVRRDIPGAFCECGVWRGGSVLAMLLTLQELGVENRDVHLFDTFEGMTEPTAADQSDHDTSALEEWRRASEAGVRPWPEFFAADQFDEDSVSQTLLATGYPRARLHLVAGAVEQTIPEHAPDRLAVLRLDTDWYESTRHELEHLYPRLHDGGVLMIDDYGHWKGARKAVDEYFGTRAAPLLLSHGLHGPHGHQALRARRAAPSAWRARRPTLGAVSPSGT